MNKYLSTALITLCATPSAFAAVGSGLYFTAGAGAGWLDFNELQSFDLDYELLFFNATNDDALNQAVLDNFNNNSEYSDETASVLAGRAAVGYLWDVFDGEPTKIGGDIYTVRATLGLEFGYRLFENVDTTLSQVVPGSIFVPPFNTYETINQEISNQAYDLSAVLRLPFTEDSKLALLLKGGVAYNLYEVKSTITIEGTQPPGYPLSYDRTIHDTQKDNEFLPVVAGALEYMIWDNVGVSAEYNAIFGSDNANSQLLIGNLIVRI